MLRGGAGGVLVKIAATVLALGAAIVLARNLGAEGYGIYAYVFALISLLAIPAQFGLPNLVVRETAKAEAGAQWGLMRGLWRWANGAAGFLSVVLAIFAGSIAWAWADNFSDIQLMTFTAGLFLIPCIALGNLRGAALRGLRKVVIGLLPEYVLRPGLLILFVLSVVFIFPTKEFDAATAMSLHVIAALVAFGFGVCLLYRSRPVPLSDRPQPIYESRLWALSAFPMGMIAAMQVVNNYTDILMLGLFLGAEHVGIYKISVQMATLVSFPITAVNLVIAPHISKLHAAGDLIRLQRLLTASAITVFLGAAVVVGALFFVGTYVIDLSFGSAFRESYAPMLVLCFGQLVVATLGSIVTVANMTGYERFVAKIIGIGAAANIVSNAILIPRYGMMGAAAATVASLALWRIVLFWRLKAWLGINPSIIGTIRKV